MRKLVILFTLICCFNNATFAGWPIGKGRTLLVPGYGTFFGNQYFDKDGKVKSFPYEGDYFKSYYLSFLFGHGVSRRLDFLVSIPYIVQQSKQAGKFIESRNFGDAMIGFAYSKENRNYTRFFTTQVSAIIPLYKNSYTILPVGFGANGIDVTFNYSQNPASFKTGGYWMLQTSYRHYFDVDGPDQFLARAALCLVYKRFNQIIFSVDGIHSESTNGSFDLNPKIVKNFDAVKAGIMLGRKIRRTVTLYVSGDYTFWGRNTLMGYGISANLTARLP